MTSSDKAEMTSSDSHIVKDAFSPPSGLAPFLMTMMVIKIVPL